MKNIMELQKTSQNVIPIEQLHFVPGLWVNGKCCWLYNSTEKVIYDEEITVNMKRDRVHSKISLSTIFVRNHSSQGKNIKVLAIHYHTNILADNLAFVSPAENRIFHMAKDHIFLVNAVYNGTGIKDYTTVPLWSTFSDEIWSDPKNGTLKYQPISKGPAASIFAVPMLLGPNQMAKMYTWTIDGVNKNELIFLERALSNNLT